jgi:hypothetical protein
MKIRKGYENLQYEIQQLDYWFNKTDKNNILQIKDYALNIIRVLFFTDFIEAIDKFREEIKYVIFTPPLTDDKSEFITNWINEHPDAPQNWYDDRIGDLCLRYSLDPIRFASFVEGYLYYRECHPFVPIDVATPILENEARYKSKFEFIYGNSNSPKAGYVRFYKDTTINQIVQFVRANKNIIKRTQQTLSEYPHQYSHHMGTFPDQLRIFLLYIQGHTDREINEIMEKGKRGNFEEDRIRKIISSMKKILKNYAGLDIYSAEYFDKNIDNKVFYHGQKQTVKKP